MNERGSEMYNFEAPDTLEAFLNPDTTLEQWEAHGFRVPAVANETTIRVKNNSKVNGVIAKQE